MKTVFISGSRSISHIPNICLKRLDNIMNSGYNIIIGDAAGIDTQVQSFLNSEHYRSVKVFCSGQNCRNNIGRWETVNVIPTSDLDKRGFYTVKDKQMAKVADVGFVIWDGMSQGTYSNIEEMITYGKPVLVYNKLNSGFTTVKTEKDVIDMLYQVR